MKLPVADIIPMRSGQPRQEFEAEESSIADLAESIRREGLLEPVIVRRVKVDGVTKLELISGERRTRAVSLLGHTHIEGTIRDCNSDEDAFVLAVLANVRKALTPLEESRSVARVWEMKRYAHMPVNARYIAVAAVFGRSRRWVSDRVSINDTCTEVQQVYDAKIPALTTASAAFLKRMTEEEQVETLRRVDGMNKRSSERFIRKQIQAAEGHRWTTINQAANRANATKTRHSDAQRVIELVLQLKATAESLKGFDHDKMADAFKGRDQEMTRAMQVANDAARLVEQVRSKLRLIQKEVR